MKMINKSHIGYESFYIFQDQGKIYSVRVPRKGYAVPLTLPPYCDLQEQALAATLLQHYQFLKTLDCGDNLAEILESMVIELKGSKEYERK